MDAFSSDELTRMQAAQVDGMMDTCTVWRYMDGASDEYGMPNPTWVFGAICSCGYDGRRHVEAGVPGGTPITQAALTDGRIRLPIDTQISLLDRIELTHRFGVMLDAGVMYELAGEPRRGPSGLLCDVRKVSSNG